MPDIFSSVEDIWIIWLVCSCVVGVLIHRACRGFSLSSIGRFWNDEEGASYALPYVLTFPIFLLLMAVLLQATLILLCKFGSIYSAHASARTVVVWQGSYPTDPADGKTYTRYKAKRAAVMAMVPYANSSTLDRKSLFPFYPASFENKFLGGIDLPASFANLVTNIDRIFYKGACKRLLADANEKDTATVSPVIRNRTASTRDSYIDRKYSYAAAATWVDYPEEVVPWNEDLSVTVTYRMAFHIPGTARILRGSRSFWSKRFYRDIKSTVTLPSEAAETPSGQIGIPYDPSLLRRIKGSPNPT